MPEAGRLGWVIVYVPDVGEAIDFYERAFGLARRFVGDGFAELDTGTTSLSFASDTVAQANMGASFERHELDRPPANVEIALVYDDVAAAFERAVEAGCAAVAQPSDKPHGQTVSYVRDPWGTLIEICSPVG